MRIAPVLGALCAGRIGHGIDFMWQRDPFQVAVPENDSRRGSSQESTLRKRDSPTESPGVD